MRNRVLRRALLIAAVVTMLTAAFATADTVPVTGDSVVPGAEIDLGKVGPGAVIERDVTFELRCSGFRHVNATQTVVLTPGAQMVPEGGAATSTGTTIAPPGSGWPEDGFDCASSPAPVPASGVSHVTLTAPMTPGDDYVYLLTWDPSLEPIAAGDSGTFSGMTSVTFTVDVVVNTPPVLTVPGSDTVEGNTAGGWTGGWAVGAADAEDDPDPTPTCAPAPGTVLPLGTTTVSCSVTDAGGLRVSGSFDWTVVDTTAPQLVGLPGGVSLTTADPAGAVLAYSEPTAADTVDASPSVVCSPAPGTIAPVGSSSVTCTATDDSGNSTSASFPVTVTLATWVVAWGEPISGDPPSVSVNSGRALRISVDITLNGATVAAGNAAVVVTSCGGTRTLATAPLAFASANRGWIGRLETGALAAGCYRGTLVLDGAGIGSFGLTVTAGPGPAKTRG